MQLLYNILFVLFAVLTAPFYLLKMQRRGNWRREFRQRLGSYNAKLKEAVTNRNVLWIHAVSVGEVNVCTQLIRALEPRLPNIKIVVSTTTSTGREQLEKQLPRHIEKIYFPIDCRPFVRRALTVFHPEAVVLVEAEIWPNFLWRAKERRVPVFLVNARMSSRSYRGYRRFSRLFRPLFASLAGVGAQNEEDARKLRELGCRTEAVHVVGSMKFDGARPEERPTVPIDVLLRQIGVNEDALVLVGGSTHAGEETLLADMVKRLRQQFPSLFLVLVPRHFERGGEVGRELSDHNIRFLFRTLISLDEDYAPGEIECLLVNTTGELRFFYEHASLIFIGKSLTAEGGQNPIEAAALGKPIIFGPNMQNFASIAEKFLAERAAIQIQTSQELEKTVVDLLNAPHQRHELGKNARRVVQENKGAIERTADMIVNRLPADRIYLRD